MSQEITRRGFLGQAAGLAGAIAAAPAFAQSDSRPNIILCMGDDHGASETGYSGHPYLLTPVLDEMAESGLRFDRFYSASPVCSPTRASVMTGRHPNRCGTFSANWSTRPEEITIAHTLRKAGYACGHFGKWHLGPVKADSPTNPGAMGFEEWLSHDNFFEMNPQFSRNGGPPEQFKGESSEIVVNEAMRFIRKAKQDKRPFFAVLWFGSPHEPYSGLDADLALYAGLPASLGERFANITDMKSGQTGKFPLDKVLQARFAEITAMDRAIGKLRTSLQSEGLRQNTLLWYCGDNGVPGEGRLEMPFRGSKGDVYEGGVRVPSVIEWPQRITKPRATDVNAVTSDMLPTICDLVGLPIPERPIDGISLQPLFDGAMTARPRPICFWNFDARGEGDNAEPYLDPVLQAGTTPLVKLMDGRATRSFTNFHHPRITEQDFAGARAILHNRYKLVVDGQGPRRSGAGSSPVRELYDLRQDESESNDIIAANPATVRSMERQLRDWQQSVLESLTGADYS
jgi:arylsulfatase A-like enzyme